MVNDMTTTSAVQPAAMNILDILNCVMDKHAAELTAITSTHNIMYTTELSYIVMNSQQSSLYRMKNNCVR